MLTVAIVEDHPVFREALKQILAQSKTEIESAEADSFDALKESLKARPATDLVLLDLEIPGAQGFSALAYVHYHYPSIRIAVVSGHEDKDIVERALSLGADAFIPKSLPLQPLVTALETVLAGDRWVPDVKALESAESQKTTELARRVSALSPQQRRVVMGMAQGRLNKQIAYELGITEGTVKNHVTSILRHLGLRRRTEVVAEIHRLMQVKQNSIMDAADEAT